MVNRPKPRAPWDLLAILALTALLLICVVLTSSNIPRIMLGLPFLLFLPGYVLLSALFPGRARLEGTERVALSFVLSMAIVSLLGLLLNFVWEVSLYPVLTSVAAMVACMTALAYFRRARLPPQEQYRPHLNLRIPPMQPMSRRDRILAACLAILLVGAIGVLVYVAGRPRNIQHFTDFYVLGASGAVSSYPSEIVLGTHAEVTIGTVNREGEEVTYHLRVLLNKSEVEAANGVTLADGATWEETVTLTPIVAGDDQQVEFLLYRADESEPYRRLHLWIDVRDPSAPPSTP